MRQKSFVVSELTDQRAQFLPTWQHVQYPPVRSDVVMWQLFFKGALLYGTQTRNVIQNQSHNSMTKQWRIRSFLRRGKCQTVALLYGIPLGVLVTIVTQNCSAKTALLDHHFVSLLRFPPCIQFEKDILYPPKESKIFAIAG